MPIDTDERVRVTVVLTAEQHDALREISFHERTTQQDLMRKAVDRLLKSKGYK